MARQYKHITRTPTFLKEYASLRAYLREKSPMAYAALPEGTKTILDVIDDMPKGWPHRKRHVCGIDVEFHLAIVKIAYRTLHVRYLVTEDTPPKSILLAVWVDGQDEPAYEL